MIKKFIVGTLVVVALSFAGSALAAYDFGTTTLKVGSKGAAVMSVQTLVGATADGSFGPMTAAKVKVWQAANGLVADGVFGAKSKAVANATVTTTTTTTTTTTVAGCSAGALFNSITGASCATATSTVAGCAAGALFSSTTGASCAAGTTTVVTGGAGNLIVSPTTSADVETEVSEGDANVKVLGFRVEADGSDVNVTNLKVTMSTTGVTSSTRIERYMSDVSVYMGSTKVGSASSADFNKDGTTYTKNIALTGATIKEGDKPYFYVAVSALANIDSGDLDSEVWTIDASDVRFVDGTGMVLTDTTNITATTPNFIDLATSGDVKLNITKGASSPVAGNVKVSDTGSTSDVLLNQFKLKATGSDMTLSKINVTLTSTGATVAEAASEVTIKVGGLQIASNDVVLATTGSYAFTLDNDLVIKAGETVTFDVFAKINKIGTATFLQGEALKADYTSSVIEDKNGDAVSDISGASLGETQTFFSEGVNASNFSSTVATTTDTSGVTTKQTYTATFSLTSFGNTYYLPKGVEKSAGLSDNDTNGLSYAVESSLGVATSYDNVAVTSTASALTSTASTVGGYYEIADGETKTFSVTIEITPGSSPVPGFYHVQLGSVLYDLNQTASGSDEGVYTFAPAQNFETSDRSI